MSGNYSNNTIIIIIPICGPMFGVGGRDHKLTGVCTNWPIQNYKESQEIRGTPRWAESRAPASFMRSLLQSRDHLVVLRTLGTLILSISPHFIIPWLGSATKISIFWLKEDLPWLIWENRVVMGLGVSKAGSGKIVLTQNYHTADNMRVWHNFLGNVKNGRLVPASHIILTNVMLMRWPWVTPSQCHHLHP